MLNAQFSLLHYTDSEYQMSLTGNLGLVTSFELAIALMSSMLQFILWPISLKPIKFH